jgi:hypothetical protein
VCASFGDVVMAAMPVVTIRASTAAQLVDAFNSASSAQTTVVLVAPGHYQLTPRFHAGNADSALPPVRSAVFVIGTDAANTILDAGSSFGLGRVLTVLRGGSLSLRNITVTGGSVSPSEDEFGGAGGGGIANIGGYLRLDDCVVSNNVAASETGVLGGGIFSSGTLHVERTRIVDNHAENLGGGIAALGAKVFIADSIISGNRATSPFTGAGGGALLVTSSGTIVRTTIADNMSNHFGGGLHVGGALSITDSAVVGNLTLDDVESRRSFGGGIYNFALLRLKNVTVAGNTGATLGGGIYNDQMLVLRGSTIVRNHVLGRRDADEIVGECPPRQYDVCTGGGGIWNAEGRGVVSAARSIVALNTIVDTIPEVGELGPDCAGPFISEGANAIGDLSGCDVRPSHVLQGRPTNDIIGDPRLGALQDDGTAGNAHAPLLADSLLIDAGGPLSNVCTVRDQIGQPRVDGNSDGLRRCDIGAIEFQTLE